MLQASTKRATLISNPLAVVGCLFVMRFAGIGLAQVGNSLFLDCGNNDIPDTEMPLFCLQILLTLIIGKSRPGLCYLCKG